MSNYKKIGIIWHVLTLIMLMITAGCLRHNSTNWQDNEEITRPTGPPSKEDEDVGKYFDARRHFIFFDKKDIRFKDSYANELLIVFDEVKKLKNSCVEIYGYDSLDHDYSSSKKVAEQRAEWTRRCLLGEGVDERYIKIVRGMAPVALAKKASAEDVRHSKRVEVHVVPCDDSDFKLKNRIQDIDLDNPFKYKEKER